MNATAMFTDPAAIAVRDRPILMSGPMVRATLDLRKTKTRRVVMPQPSSAFPEGELTGDFLKAHVRCPYGQQGDRLWVRETAWYDEAFGGRVFYDGGTMQKRLGGGVVSANGKPSSESQTRKPSIFMPRWASRLTLEITDVRVERLQDITADEAEAEGLSKITKDGGRVWKYGIPDRDGLPGSDDDGWDWHRWRQSPVDAYQVLWDSLNAKRGYGWDVDPWVWALTFKVVTS